jgi:predicted enzyme related to lactoylglutathione lyase
MIEAIKFVLMVRDMGRAVAFYRDAMGLQLVLQSALWSELARGDDRVRGTGLSFQVDDIRAACERAVAGGAALQRGPEHRPGDPVALAELVDPEGNVFMLSQGSSEPRRTPRR